MRKNYYTNLTIFSLFLGYTGYYLCRTNLSVANPDILDDKTLIGISEKSMATVFAWGVSAYALGKLLSGFMGDFFGGKKLFIFGMVGSALVTVAFGFADGVLAFSIITFLNRLIQAMGWSGLVKITSNWIDYRKYGKVMSILSVSYMVGDILARLILGQFQKWGYNWHQLFFISAGMLGVIAVYNIVFLKEKPSQVGLPEPEQNPVNLFAENDNNEKLSLLQLLLPYFRNFSFILVLLMSFGLTAIRQTLNEWSPTYLQRVFHFSKGDASQLSSLYLILGSVSILLCGWLSDKIGKRGLMICLSSIPVVILFILLTFLNDSPITSVILFSLVGFFLLGPYSFLGGAMALDFGGKKGASTASGLADSFGYIGGTIAVKLTGTLAEENNWNGAFLMLAGIAFFTATTALVYYLTQERVKKVTA